EEGWLLKTALAFEIASPVTFTGPSLLRGQLSKLVHGAPVGSPRNTTASLASAACEQGPVVASVCDRGHCTNFVSLHLARDVRSLLRDDGQAVTLSLGVAWPRTWRSSSRAVCPMMASKRD